MFYINIILSTQFFAHHSADDFTYGGRVYRIFIFCGVDLDFFALAFRERPCYIDIMIFMLYLVHMPDPLIYILGQIKRKLSD